MSTAQAWFLGAAAIALVVMALIQVAAIAWGILAARRVERLLGRLERDLQPAIERVNSLTAEAARAAGLASAQVERVDRLTAELGQRVQASAAAMQRAIGRPAREGAAIVAGVRAGLVTLRDQRRRRRAGAGEGGSAAGDEDPWFIG